VQVANEDIIINGVGEEGGNKRYALFDTLSSGKVSKIARGRSWSSCRQKKETVRAKGKTYFLVGIADALLLALRVLLRSVLEVLCLGQDGPCLDNVVVCSRDGLCIRWLVEEVEAKTVIPSGNCANPLLNWWRPTPGWSC
jgi:hypothetical protein